MTHMIRVMMGISRPCRVCTEETQRELDPSLLGEPIQALEDEWGPSLHRADLQQEEWSFR